ncbi:uncharacterized protein LOC116686149 [Etheostoma spectabile]|uniref:uncharacterized protein LOC116684514 n=1 Tax=Etheostoma spectabile TaxID=54343 RepID=UPI0013AF587F|nr:uncharacterized protein LOC116684514 [Etheostoma spectabile]XP_032367008.1 uncharacterized protein LOC116686149 [Etheostoma spectabile]
MSLLIETSEGIFRAAVPRGFMLLSDGLFLKGLDAGGTRLQLKGSPGIQTAVPLRRHILHLSTAPGRGGNATMLPSGNRLRPLLGASHGRGSHQCCPQLCRRLLTWPTRQSLLQYEASPLLLEDGRPGGEEKGPSCWFCGPGCGKGPRYNAVGGTTGEPKEEDEGLNDGSPAMVTRRAEDGHQTVEGSSRESEVHPHVTFPVKIQCQ